VKGRNRLGEHRQQPRGRVVGYLPVWLRNGAYTERDIDRATVTTVAHFAVHPCSDGMIEIPTWAPLPDPALVGRVHAAGAISLLVIGSDHAGVRDGFATMATSPEMRQTFAAAITQHVAQDGYDGIDLDRQFTPNADGRNHPDAVVASLCAGLTPDKTLPISASAGDYRGRWFGLPALMPNLAWLAVLTHALGGAGSSDRSFHSAALYPTFARSMVSPASVAESRRASG
jgi:hypothetical protein